MRKRIFVAFDLPREIAGELKKFRWSIPDLNWVHPSNLHITLCFLGSCDEDLGLPRISELTAKTAADFAPQKISFDSVSIHNKMVWANVVPEIGLNQLRSVLTERYLQAGLLDGRLISRVFRPHACLARAKRVIAAADFPPVKIDLEFTATHLVVFESVLRSDFPRYVSLDAYKLNYQVA